MGEQFDKLVRDGEEGLQALIDLGQPEHVQLDFKRKSDCGNGTLNDSDKRTLSEALSGFSNSAGGLLIWGVDARRGDDGVDCAQALNPIQEIEKFNTGVLGLVGQFLMPRHEGVRTAVLKSAGDSNSGYLLLEVDRSERRPHRSEARGKKGYFKRVGDSFIEMEHYDIEDAFNRTHVPDLEFAWRADETMHSGADGGGGFSADLTLQLRNCSTRTAKYPYLYVRKPKGAMLDYIRGSPQGFKVRREGDWTYFVGGADQVINPETRSSIAMLNINVSPSTPNGGLDRINGSLIDDFEISFDYKHGCEDSRLCSGQCILGGREILCALAHHIPGATDNTSHPSLQSSGSRQPLTSPARSKPRPGEASE